MKTTSFQRKRSTAVRSALIGVSAFALAGCKEEVDVSFFQSAEQCRSALDNSSEFSSVEFSAADCEAAFEDAREEHAVLAPRYTDLALCEEQHGEGACAPPEVAGGVEGEEQAAGHGSIFMPLFMGYMMGNMLSGGQRAISGRPLYSDGKGGVYNTSGQRMGFTGFGSTTKAAPNALRTPPNPKVAAPMSRANVAARGGFGSSRSVSFGG
ncbi:DUF1190 domain-containing protein [Amaricoccus macauensis]|uniref:DUF1190 domain-containing protein n=1 Tax=Amaricoccus macauensis TaxID=57001 RepID=UPI003C7DF299